MTGHGDQATDEDIRRIIEENEAGVSDLLTAYGPIEQSYFAAVAPQPTTTYSTNTCVQ